MISEAFAKTQIKRLSRLRNFPSRDDETALRADLVATLREAASEAQARGIVDDWLHASGDAPTVADLWRLVEQPQSTRSPIEIVCERCQGTGWIVVFHEREQTEMAHRCPECTKSRHA